MVSFGTGRAESSIFCLNCWGVLRGQRGPYPCDAARGRIRATPRSASAGAGGRYGGAVRASRPAACWVTTCPCGGRDLREERSAPPERQRGPTQTSRRALCLPRTGKAPAPSTRTGCATVSRRRALARAGHSQRCGGGRLRTHGMRLRRGNPPRRHRSPTTPRRCRGEPEGPGEQGLRAGQYSIFNPGGHSV